MRAQQLLICLSLFCLYTTPVLAIVIRHDVAEEQYLVEQAPAAMVDMPVEGHGMLIATEWIVTAAHVIFHDYKGKMTIRIGDIQHEIEYIIFHPGYSKPAEGLFTGDSARGQAYLRANHDIALIKLKRPATTVEPIQLYRGDLESGEIVTFYGKGATGDGANGETEKTKDVLRRAENKIAAASEQWITYYFDQGNEALPLEGMQGSGDSGGPALIHSDGVDYLAGLASWDVYEGDLADFRAGAYGLGAQLIRLSYYADWIDEVMQWPDAALSKRHYKIGRPNTDQ